MGFLAEARGAYSAAFGSALAFGQGTTALGTWAFAGGDFDWTGAGGRPGNIVEIVNGTAVGFSASASADGATSLGANAKARAVDSVALGSGAIAQAGADNSVALGAGSLADRANTVSVGTVGGERQITNVAAGTADTDAVNFGQFNSALTAIGADNAVQLGSVASAFGGWCHVRQRHVHRPDLRHPGHQLLQRRRCVLRLRWCDHRLDARFSAFDGALPA